MNVGTARDYFTAGLGALGVLVAEAPPDRDRALAAFTLATDVDPTMGDAWLGRAAAGDRSGACVLGLYRSRTRIGADQRRIGLAAGHLVGHLPTGMFIDLPVSTASDAAVVYAASLLAGGDPDGAADVLDADADGPSTPYCRALIALTRREWRSVLEALSGPPSSDEYLRAACDFLAGTACAHLGLFDEGLRRLESVRDSVLTNARAQSLFMMGMILRTRGEENAALPCFQEAYAVDPTLSEAAHALADPRYRLAVEGADTTPAETQASPDDAAALAVIDELNAQIGLVAVKAQVDRLRSAARLAQVRTEKGLRTQSRSLHLAFTGPPGTGKTTVARLVARLFRALGVLDSDTVVEVSRKDLVGTHLGSTSPKTSAVIDSAVGGVLLIDEAYTLIQEGLAGGDAFGREAVDTLLARMENDRDRLVVIIAGYDDEINRLLAANEGLASRFSRRLHFESYTPPELVRIAESIAQSRDSRLDPGAVQVLEESFDVLCSSVVGSRPAIDVAGNGRHARNLIEAAEEEREHRLASSADLDSLTDVDLMTITAFDVQTALTRVAAG
ncbi:MAG: type VII secretion AAA-ATPase EccA [Gordonia sp. (in: high G+C Gram-positive bacteria)]|jgi:type VII secretion ATPase EccA|nr:type VII secretion AAA-ATPase EccA [Gordonia sp. (in: high G+C Gram-positive bacteria)]